MIQFPKTEINDENLKKIKKLTFWILLCPLLVLGLLLLIFSILFLFIPYGTFLAWLERLAKYKISQTGINTFFNGTGCEEFDQFFLRKIRGMKYLCLFQNEKFNGVWKRIVRQKRFISEGEAAIYIQEEGYRLYFNLETPFRKFKAGNRIKAQNIILKLEEYNRRKLAGMPVPSKRELNLHNEEEGFGHMQVKVKDDSRGGQGHFSEGSINLKEEFAFRNNKFFYLFLAVCLAGFISSYIRSSNP